VVGLVHLGVLAVSPALVTQQKAPMAPFVFKSNGRCAALNYSKLNRTNL
jgi:hypothetical protein